MDKKENLNDALTALSMLRQKKQEETTNKEDAVKDARIKLFEAFSANKNIKNEKEQESANKNVQQTTTNIFEDKQDNSHLNKDDDDGQQVCLPERPQSHTNSEIKNNETDNENDNNADNFSEQENAFCEPNKSGTKPTETTVPSFENIEYADNSYLDNLTKEKTELTVQDSPQNTADKNGPQNLEEENTNNQSLEENKEVTEVVDSVEENQVVDNINKEEEPVSETETTDEINFEKSKNLTDEVSNNNDEENVGLEEDGESEESDDDDDFVNFDYPQKTVCHMQDNLADAERLVGDDANQKESANFEYDIDEEKENVIASSEQEEYEHVFDDTKSDDGLDRQDEEDKKEDEVIFDNPVEIKDDTVTEEDSNENLENNKAKATDLINDEIIDFDHFVDSDVNLETLPSEEDVSDFLNSQPEENDELEEDANLQLQKQKEEQTKDLLARFTPVTLRPKSQTPDIKTEETANSLSAVENEKEEEMGERVEEKQVAYNVGKEEEIQEKVVEEEDLKTSSTKKDKNSKAKKSKATQLNLNENDIASGRKVAWMAYILFFIPLFFDKKNTFVRLHVNEGLDIFIVDIISTIFILSNLFIKTTIMWLQFSLMIIYFLGLGFLILTTLTKLFMIIASLMGKSFQTPWLWKTRLIK